MIFKSKKFAQHYGSHIGNILVSTKLNIFRDNGIVISISLIQWIVEFIHMVIYYSYIYMLNGYSNLIDKFFNLYAIVVNVIILPCFYLNGEAAFRRNLVTFGPMRAMKNVITGKM